MTTRHSVAFEYAERWLAEDPTRRIVFKHHPAGGSELGVELHSSEGVTGAGASSGACRTGSEGPAPRWRTPPLCPRSRRA